jgi:hypothetical protein
MDTPEISEVAVRVTGFDTLATVADRVNQALAPMTTPKGQPFRIMALFVAEGFCLGLTGALAGAALEPVDALRHV